MAQGCTQTEATEEIRFLIPDNWSRQLLLRLCRRYEIRELGGALSAYLAKSRRS